jgi:hypothetical protein
MKRGINDKSAVLQMAKNVSRKAFDVSRQPTNPQPATRSRGVGMTRFTSHVSSNFVELDDNVGRKASRSVDEKKEKLQRRDWTRRTGVYAAIAHGNLSTINLRRSFGADGVQAEIGMFHTHGMCPWMKPQLPTFRVVIK